MAGLSLRQAATEAGTSKSTILRAIQGGRLSAVRTDDGGYSIDPAELFRVYEPKKPDNDAHQGRTDAVGQKATLQKDAAILGPFDIELRIANARLEAELMALKAILENERKRSEQLETDRDRWARQAERLTIAAPIPSSSPAMSQKPSQATFWQRLTRRTA